MAEQRAIVSRGGFNSQILNADTLDVGSGIDVNVAGPMTIGGVKQTLLTLGQADALITLEPGTGIAQVNALSVTINGNVIVAQALATLGFFGATGVSKRTIAGNITAIADANTRAVLHSIIDALKASPTGYGLVNDTTT